MQPIVSIVTATFNRAHLIQETLRSIQKQTYKNWECLIIDDGSTDQTEKVVESFSKSDPRFKYSKRGNEHLKGLPGCRNDGLEKAMGQFIVFFDDDDIVHPNNLEICISEFNRSEIDFCRYQREVFKQKFSMHFNQSMDYQKKNLDKTCIPKVVTGQIPFNSCQVMWKRGCFKNHKFNEDLMYAEEWECYLRILSEGCVGVSIDKILFYARKHPHSNTGEFWNNDPIRRKSKVDAIRLVVNNLISKDLMTPELLRHFIQLGIFLKEKTVVKHVLEKTGATSLTKLRFNLLYDLYPIIALGHRTRKLLKKG